MIEIIYGLPENVVALAAHGKVTGEDYDKTVIPAIEEKLRMHKKLRFFYRLGDDFTGYTTGAVWDDAKMGIKYFTSFEKVAVVTDVRWVTDVVKVFGILVPCPVKIFSNADSAKAKLWLNE